MHGFIESAFDSVWHNGLICKMYKLNTTMEIPKLIQSIFYERTFFSLSDHPVQIENPLLQVVLKDLLCHPYTNGFRIQNCIKILVVHSLQHLYGHCCKYFHLIKNKLSYAWRLDRANRLTKYLKGNINKYLKLRYETDTPNTLVNVGLVKSKQSLCSMLRLTYGRQQQKKGSD